MKIHIIGCSGSGKTYFANALSEKYGIPHYDLDDICWDKCAGKYGIKAPEEKRNAELAEIVKKDDWITEGIYYAWVGECFENADVIYLLDIPPLVYKYRIIRRFIRRKLGIEKSKKETLKSLFDLLKWTDKFQKNNLIEIKKILSGYADKTVVIRNSEEIKQILLKP